MTLDKYYISYFIANIITKSTQFILLNYSMTDCKKLHGIIFFFKLADSPKNKSSKKSILSDDRAIKARKYQS